MGQLADGRRRRWVMIGSLLSVLAGTVLAASTNNFPALITGRALQGVGLGLIPVAMVMARRHLPVARSTPAIAILSVTVATGLGLGYPLTGLIAETFDYHVAFWVGAGMVAAALVLAVVVLPTDSTGPPSHVDIVGAALFSVTLVAGLTALSEGGIWGWDSVAVIGLLVASAVFGVISVRYELRVDRPLIVLAQLRAPVVVAADVVLLPDRARDVPVHADHRRVRPDPACCPATGSARRCWWPACAWCRCRPRPPSRRRSCGSCATATAPGSP